MKRLSDVVEALCQRDHLVYHKRSADPSQPEVVSIALKYLSRSTRIWCEFFIRDNERTALVVAYAGVRVPKARIGQAYEYIVRANFGLKWGRLDMEPSTGDVQFVLSHHAAGSSFSETTVRHMIAAAVGTYDTYHRGLCAVAFGRKSAYAAIRRAERPSAYVVNRVVSKLLDEHSLEIPPEEGDGNSDRSSKLDEPPSESEDV